MKIVKIFLASSSELKGDREQFEILINRKNKEYIKDRVFLDLVLWEDFLDAMSATRLQDEYNKAVADCDVFVSLFHTKVGKYTEEEFFKALETFQANGKPLIYTYFKGEPINTSQITEEILSLLSFRKKLSELGHFYTMYADINDLKYKFSEQLTKIKLTKTPEILVKPQSSNQPEAILTPEVQLKSEKGVDYSNLRDLLAQGKWKEADAETAKVMLQAANRVEHGWLQVEDVDNFPCGDLRTINQLWLHYSGGKFGFSVQAEIYRSFGGTRKYNHKVWEKFGEAVGWRVNNSWLYFSGITFDLSSPPKGHLPNKNLGIIVITDIGRDEWIDRMMGEEIAIEEDKVIMRRTSLALLSRPDL